MANRDAPDARVDYYALLGVKPTASREEITRAFRARSKDVHPDVSPDADAAVQFQRLARAYDVLGDAQARAEYDRRRGHVPIARYAGRLFGGIVVRVQRRLDR